MVNATVNGWQRIRRLFASPPAEKTVGEDTSLPMMGVGQTGADGIVGTTPPGTALWDSRLGQPSGKTGAVFMTHRLACGYAYCLSGIISKRRKGRSVCGIRGWETKVDRTLHLPRPPPSPGIYPASVEQHLGLLNAQVAVTGGIRGGPLFEKCRC